MPDNPKQWIDNQTELVTPPPFAPTSLAAEPATVEVAALFDDSLVDVQHLSRARGARDRGRAHMWLARGALLVGTAAGARALAGGHAAAD